MGCFDCQGRLRLLRLFIAASDSNPQPSDQKGWDPSDPHGWYAGSLPGNLKIRYLHFTQDEAARVMDDILTPIPIDLSHMKNGKD